MRLAIGSKRLVLLVGDSAIKIGRVRPLRMLSRLCVLPFSKGRREHFAKKYGASFVQAVWRDLFAGLYANRSEHGYYQATKHPLVMPTTACLFGGWVVIQLRGSPLPASEASLMLSVFGSHSRECEMTMHDQFARTPDGRIALVDYERRETQDALKTLMRPPEE